MTSRAVLRSAGLSLVSAGSDSAYASPRPSAAEFGRSGSHAMPINVYAEAEQKLGSSSSRLRAATDCTMPINIVAEIPKQTLSPKAALRPCQSEPRLRPSSARLQVEQPTVMRHNRKMKRTATLDNKVRRLLEDDELELCKEAPHPAAREADLTVASLCGRVSEKDRYQPYFSGKRMDFSQLGQFEVRPVFKSKRHIVILRDLPDGTTEEEILSLFSTGPYAENVVSVKPEVNNTWFVKFVDEVAPEVVLWLRSQTFKGKPVNAAIKSEHFLRSFFPVNQSMGFVPPGLPPMDEGDVHPMHGFPPAPFPGGKGAGCPDFMPPPGMMPPMQMGMPYEMPVEPNMQFGLQSPGFWKPWGSRHRQPPLTFSPDCPRIGNDQVAPQMESWGTGAPSKGKSKGKEDFSKGKSKKGKGTSGKWSIDWEDSAPPGYKGIKGKPSWYDESEDVAQVVPLDDRIRKASDVKAPKMKWAVKSGGESG